MSNDPKVVHSSLASHDASIHQIWDSYLQNYMRYARRMEGQCDYYMPLKVPFTAKKTFIRKKLGHTVLSIKDSSLRDPINLAKEPREKYCEWTYFNKAAV